ncbi:DUF72 domain-containing protein [Pararhizobium sp.]|uniref:DUF72 domain-containing protein n=1 Tax=Pararhizobium sp. TaxID=1977563 RepID=UPI00272568FB|nr:DUF72 domain-containing protein [Pararhizobium sp.]MDO9418490.1 DUF72 domain-containing protein [Pararhizobium sp.]
MIFIGTAGWSIPKALGVHFPPAGSALQRYASVLNCTEINSTFYRPHRPDTFKRWAESVPGHFRFSVKAPKTITHEKRLVDADEALDAFVSSITPLGQKLGPILFQLPPSLIFDRLQADRFFTTVRERWQGAVVLEPRHKSWAAAEAEELVMRHSITWVFADPPKVERTIEPNSDGLYLRLHGAPKVYYSSYGKDDLHRYRLAMDRSQAGESWCIFDNTASGAALSNALDLQSLEPMVR